MEDKKRKDVDLDEVEDLEEDIDFDEIDEIDDDEEIEDTKRRKDDEDDFDDDEVDEVDDTEESLEEDDDEDFDEDFEDEDEEDLDDEDDDESEKSDKEKAVSKDSKEKKSKDSDRDELLEDEGESFGAKIVIAIVIIAIIIILLLKACGGKKEQYKVTFDTKGGTAVESLMVDKDGTFTEPKAPTKEGYTFAGWYYNDELYDFDTKVTGNIKLEARWNKADDTSVTGVTLNETALSLKPGSTATLVATVSPESAKDKSLTWSSSDESIVTVDENGKVKAIKEGKATITVTTKDGNHKATVTITVSKEDIKVTGVSFSNTTLNLATGSSMTLKPTISPSDATNKGLTWKSSDSSIVSVSDKGVITGRKEGKATITVTTKDGGYTATITVTVKDEPVTGVKIQGNSSMVINGKQTLKAVISPSNATNKGVTWESSDPSIATVDSKGNVVAKEKGTVTITVTTKDGNHKATLNINVKEQLVTKITISGSKKVNVGKTITLKATVSPSNATNKGVTWSSSDESIATVDANGKVTGKKAGKVTIKATAKDGSKVSKTYTIEVVEEKVTYTITLKEVPDPLGSITQYTYVVKANGKTTEDYLYFNIGGLNVWPDSGTVAAKYAGSKEATIYLEGKQVKATVTIAK